jgi:hypothetical protein
MEKGYLFKLGEETTDGTSRGYTFPLAIDSISMCVQI